jgi:hypothetical protein
LRAHDRAQRVADGRSEADDAVRRSPDLRHHYDWRRRVDPDKARAVGIGRQDILVACERH